MPDTKSVTHRLFDSAGIPHTEPERMREWIANNGGTIRREWTVTNRHGVASGQQFAVVADGNFYHCYPTPNGYTWMLGRPGCVCAEALCACRDVEGIIGPESREEVSAFRDYLITGGRNAHGSFRNYRRIDVDTFNAARFAIAKARGTTP